MSPAEKLLFEATRESDAARADRMAYQAICQEPSLGPAYALRARLAARRADAVVAAHYFRVAFARGDRSPATRAGLAACLTAAGQADAARRVRGLADLPPELADFVELLAGQGGALRGVLGAKLPADDQPALLPGEGRPSGARPSAPTPRPAPPTPRAPVEAEPAAPTVRVARRKAAAPEWLETIERSVPTASAATPPAWLETDLVSVAPSTGRRINTDERLELVTDPGAPQVVIRSPVTGRVSEPVAAPSTTSTWQGAPADVLEARSDFGPDLSPAVFLAAVRMPGPVMTASGRSPQQMARWMSVGVTQSEIAMRDAEDSAAKIIRLPVELVSMLEVVGDGRQISLTLRDRRQLHLDLRQLRSRAFRTAVEFTEILSDALTG